MTDTQTVTVRPAESSDVDTIVGMAERFVSGGAYRTRMPTSPEHVRRLYHFFIAQGGGFVAVAEDGRLLGMLIATVYDHAVLDVKVGAEVIVWVDPEARRSGVGRELFAAAEAWAKAQGAVQMHATSLRNPAAERWYEALGYQAQEVMFSKDL